MNYTLDPDPSCHSADPETRQTLDRLQRDAFGYFLTFTNRENGLVRDRDNPDAPCSIAVVGFALSCYPVGVERGWIDRGAAAALVRTTLRFFARSAQGDAGHGVTAGRKLART